MDLETREIIKRHLIGTCDNFIRGYMKVYDEFYSKENPEDRDYEDSVIKELADAFIGIEAVIEVYARDGKIHETYVIEKLNSSIRTLSWVISYYSQKREEKI